ncbi:MAG: NAD(P)H-dependent oxidoreductase [Actinomycetaceae bacterium]|nr:NAD(P)H-dependent oxidoreductase [Actinomycetaceae bacterium]
METKRTLVILDHPYGIEGARNIPHKRSFTAALAQKAITDLNERGHKVDVIDLHADGFDPVMHAEDLQSWRKVENIDPLVCNYQERIKRADRLAFFFPIWWELMPAMTKGFIDKVYAKNVLYTQESTPFHSLLDPIPEVIVTTVMNTPLSLYKTIFGNPLTKALKRGTFWKTGLKKYTWHSFNGVEKMSPEKREDILKKFHL